MNIVKIFVKKIENENVGTAKDVQNFRNTLEDIKKLIEKMTIQLEKLYVLIYIY